MKCARDIVAERVPHQERIDHMRLKIADNRGTILGTVFFFELVRLD